MNVTNPEGTIISYSTDGENYGSDNPSFTNAGTYTVYYRITKDNYNTISKNSTVNVAKAASAPNKPDSTMDVDYGKEKVSDITTLPEGWAWQDEDQDKALRHRGAAGAHPHRAAPHPQSLRRPAAGGRRVYGGRPDHRLQ